MHYFYVIKPIQTNVREIGRRVKQIVILNVDGRHLAQ